MNPFFNIQLPHYLLLSIVLFSAGVATMLTKRNAIGILIGVELVLNAAAINFVAFNHYAWAGQTQVIQSLTEANIGETVHITMNPPDPTAATSVTLDQRGVTVNPPGASHVAIAGSSVTFSVVRSGLDGMVFTMFIIVLAAAEAAVALAIFLNYYNVFSSIDVERADELKG